jgi:hypothetical protein
VKEITVKGRAQPVMTYEVLGIQGDPTPAGAAAPVLAAEAGGE